MKAAATTRTSDVTRFRGVAIAAVVAAALVAGLALTAHPVHDLPLPHARAHVACASCHTGGPIAAACTGCHGPHPSTRPGHAGIGCPTCHHGHDGGGVHFAPDGVATRYGAGDARPAGTTPFHPRAALSVPVPALAACIACHDPRAPADPIAACLLAGQDALGDARPTACFDEHRRVRDAAGAIAPRSAAWIAARDLLATAPTPPPRPHRGPPWSWLGLGALLAGLVVAGVRGVDRARTRAKQAPPTPPPAGPLRLPVIDAASCLGCHACVDACPYDVLEVRRYVAVVARPADCCGLTLCEQHCPNGSLVMGAPQDAPVRPALADDLESRDTPGVFLAGDVSGQPLIRTAIAQGVRAIAAIAARPRASRDRLDVLVVGAGPAGLSAALEAAARGLRYQVLEQASIADSIRSFPRGKLVIDADAASPGRLWIAEASKEELLARWLRQAREERLAIVEGRRVVGIAGSRGDFTITDATGAVHRTAHVVVAIGRRGTPRRLPVDVPDAWVDHVHYHLADARSFAGRRVVVVGLGDVAMEAAISLSRQPGAEVTMTYRGADFRRGKARNIAELRRRIAAGAVRIAWGSEVAGLPPGRVRLSSGDEVPADAVLCLIGTIATDDLLRQIVRPPHALDLGEASP